MGGGRAEIDENGEGGTGNEEKENMVGLRGVAKAAVGRILGGGRGWSGEGKEMKEEDLKTGGGGKGKRKGKRERKWHT